MKRLTPEQRAFFEQVAIIATMNPFSDERDLADRNLAGEHLEPRSETLIHELIQKVERELNAVRKTSLNGTPLKHCQESDRNLLTKAVLFHEFHAHIEQFDAFISAQQNDQNLLTPEFAISCLQKIEGWGFSQVDSENYFSLMYQLRRAYYFMSKIIQGNGPSILKLRCSLWNSVFSYDSEIFDSTLRGRMENFSILILGETGTGKSAAAQAIGMSQHIAWDGAKQRFAQHPRSLFHPVNLVEYPETLLESVLFGHKKGSFTGAISDHKGLFARTSPNSLVFLDEIGEASEAVQVKLLRVLQERIFTPVGDEHSQTFRGRIVAATNRKVADLTHGGKMRIDLFFRLCTDLIEFPPLRTLIKENPQELQRITEAIAERTLGASISKKRLDDIVTKMEVFLGKNHNWPGNIRELEQRIRQILLTGRTTLPAFDLQTNSGPEIRDSSLETLLVQAAERGIDADGILQKYCAALYAKDRSYEAVARIARLDWRTVRKLCQQEMSHPSARE